MSKNKITIICPVERFAKTWEKAIKMHVPDFEVQIYPNDTGREEVEFAMVFNPPEGVFAHFSNLKVAASMGAGVRTILTNKSLSEDVIVTKIVNPLHQRDMADFVLALALQHMRRLDVFARQKTEKYWRAHSYQRPQETTVGIMGLGAIGTVIGQQFLKNDFKVTGWSRSEKKVEGITSYFGENQKIEFLNTADILVCILPLTDDTTGILNKETFSHLPEGAFLINVARGGHLVEEDLIKALESGQLSGAALDVFSTEPLPSEHPFWINEKIFISPHTAGNTHPEVAFIKVLENYYAMKEGKELTNVVSRERGY